MIDRLRYRIPGSSERFLNHLIAWTGILVVVSLAGFVGYYYYDRRPVAPGPSPVEQSLRQAQQAVEDDPADAGARLALASVYFTVERYPESAEQYRAALGLDPENMSIVGGLARALYESGETEESATYFQQVLTTSATADLPPELVGGARYYLARIALANGKPDEAITQAKAAVALDRSDADSWELLGAANVATSKPDDAIEALSTAISFVPDFREAYAQLALAYDQKGEALHARYALAMEKYAAGDYGKAAAELKAVTAGDASFANGFLGLGMALEKQGQKTAAITAYGEALRLDPTSFNARSGLARLGSPAAPAGSDPHGPQAGGAQ